MTERGCEAGGTLWPWLWALHSVLDFMFRRLWHRGSGPLPRRHCTLPAIASFPVWSETLSTVCSVPGMGEMRDVQTWEQLSACTNCNGFSVGEMCNWPSAIFLRVVKFFPCTYSAPFSCNFYRCRNFPSAWAISRCGKRSRFVGNVFFHWSCGDI